MVPRPRDVYARQRWIGPKRDMDDCVIGSQMQRDSTLAELEIG